MVITFTRKEADVLNHRLELADCIAEVWGPENDNVWGLDADETLDRVGRLISDVFSDGPRGGLVACFDPENVDHIRLLEEAVDGNTLGCMTEDLLHFDWREPEYREGRRWLTHLRSIDEKYRSAGIDAAFNI